MKIEDRRTDEYKVLGKLDYGTVFCDEKGNKYIKTNLNEEDTLKYVCVNLFNGDICYFSGGEIVTPLDAKVVIE